MAVRVGETRMGHSAVYQVLYVPLVQVRWWRALALQLVSPAGSHAVDQHERRGTLAFASLPPRCALGWERLKRARGGASSHHLGFELTLTRSHLRLAIYI